MIGAETAVSPTRTVSRILDKIKAGTNRLSPWSKTKPPAASWRHASWPLPLLYIREMPCQTFAGKIRHQRSTYLRTISLPPVPSARYASGFKRTSPVALAVFSASESTGRVTAPRARGLHGMEPTPKCCGYNELVVSRQGDETNTLP